MIEVILGNITKGHQAPTQRECNTESGYIEISLWGLSQASVILWLCCAMCCIIFCDCSPLDSFCKTKAEKLGANSYFVFSLDSWIDFWKLSLVLSADHVCVGLRCWRWLKTYGRCSLVTLMTLPGWMHRLGKQLRRRCWFYETFRSNVLYRGLFMGYVPTYMLIRISPVLFCRPELFGKGSAILTTSWMTNTLTLSIKMYECFSFFSELV